MSCIAAATATSSFCNNRSGPKSCNSTSQKLGILVFVHDELRVQKVRDLASCYKGLHYIRVQGRQCNTKAACLLLQVNRQALSSSWRLLRFISVADVHNAADL